MTDEKKFAVTGLPKDSLPKSAEGRSTCDHGHFAVTSANFEYGPCSGHPLSQRTMSTESILLNPRPYAQVSGRLLLLPLLPHKPALKPLPSEIWWKIIGEVLDCGGQDFWRGNGIPNSARLALLTVCKRLKVFSIPPKPSVQ